MWCRLFVLYETGPLASLFAFENQSQGHIILNLLTKKIFSITGNPVKNVHKEKKN